MIRQHWLLLRRQVGRRGLFLCFLTILDTIYGYFLITVPEQSHVGDVMSQTTWGAWWLVTAALCLAGIPAKKDYISFMAASVMKASWAARSAYLWYLGMPYQWAGLVIWLVFAFTVMVIAGWPEAVE